MSLLTAWSPDLVGVVLPVVLVLALAGARWAARRHGLAWPAWRVTVYLLGCAVLVWTLNGAPAAQRTSSLWLGGVAVGLLTAVIPALLALGLPMGLASLALRGPALRIVRVLLFPLLGGVICLAVTTATFTAGWYGQALRSGGARAALMTGLLAVGVLVALPLLTADLVPAWCTPGVRALLAFADGLLDAVPGIVLMTATHPWVPGFTLGQLHLAGGALLATTEAVGLPMILIVVIEWIRADAREARRVDAEIDALDDPQQPWWQRPAGPD